MRHDAGHRKVGKGLPAVRMCGSCSLDHPHKLGVLLGVTLVELMSSRHQVVVPSFKLQNHGYSQNMRQKCECEAPKYGSQWGCHQRWSQIIAVPPHRWG